MPDVVRGRTVRLSLLRMRRRKLIRAGPRYSRCRRPSIIVIPLYVTTHGRGMLNQHLEDIGK